MIDINTLFGNTPTCKHYPYQTVLDTMKKYSIDYSLISSLKSAYYYPEEGNEETLWLCKNYKNLLPVAGCDLRNHFHAEEKVLQFKKEGFKAIRPFVEYQNTPLDIPLFQNLVLQADKYQLPILIEAPAVSIYHALETLPELSVPIVMLGQNFYKCYEVFSVMKKRENLYLETRSFNAPDVLRYMIENVSDDRLLFGSKSPYSYVLPNIFTIEYSNIPDSSKEKIFSENAKRIFSIEA